MHPWEVDTMVTLRWSVAVLVVASAAATRGAEPSRPLEVLYVTGGCCHDYEGQKKILVPALEKRGGMKVTVIHEGGSSLDHKVSIYSQPEWSKGYDVVFHNECFANVRDPEFVRGIVAEHERGTPAVLMHCAMHCYRAGTDDWFRFCGVTSPGHGKNYAYTAHTIAEHPVLRGLPREWAVPKDELYYIDKLWPGATPLVEAKSEERQAMQTVVWTNQYGKARVFGTTIGHANHTVETPEFLGLVTRGTLWAAGRLGDDGEPAAVEQPEPAAAR
ncbi:MAG: ThuA domain-containing protein [Planctomycetia bacterium]